MLSTSINKYRIVKKIGEGGMATVYLGEHLTINDREAAIKVLHPHLLEDNRNRQRFAREAQAIGRLKHANILEIYDYSGLEASECYIITEYVYGCTLQRLNRLLGLLPSEVVAIIGIELAQALAYAHRSGIIHRDLKPENVMIKPDGTVKLMDFGIARLIGETTVTMTGALIGSPAYMSPEQALERDLDARSDLFSLGGLLFHLCAGRVPFAGSNPSVILRNIIEGNRPAINELIPTISPGLADVIERLLQTDVEARYEDALQVVEALEAVLEESEIDRHTPAWTLSQLVPDPRSVEGCGRGFDDERWEQAVRESARLYEERLLIHLDRVLLARGRAAFQAGDHLGAQRLFNRLLAFNPEHPQVLELLASLHAGAPTSKKGRYTLWASALLALLIGLAGWFTLRPDGAGAQRIAARDAPEAPPAEQGADLSSEELLASFPEMVEVDDPLAIPQADPPAGPIEQGAAEPDPGPSAPGPDQTAAPIQQPVPVERAAPPAESGSPASGSNGDVVADVDLTEPALDEATPEPVVNYGTIEIGLGMRSWADVLIDDKVVGRMPRESTFDVSPGDHVLTLRNPYAYDYSEPFTIAAGEVQSFKNIILRKKPVKVRFTDALADDCLIERNGTELGTLDDLGRSLTLQNPDLRYVVRWTCPGGPRGAEDLDGLTAGATLTLPLEG